jgi:hypothetical protein
VICICVPIHERGNDKPPTSESLPGADRVAARSLFLTWHAVSVHEWG